MTDDTKEAPKKAHLTLLEFVEHDEPDENGETTGPVPMDQVLEKAIGKIEFGMVIGYCKDEGGFYLAASDQDEARMVYLLEQMKKIIMEFDLFGGEEIEE